MGDRSFRLKLIAAFLALYVIWGSTYLGILYAIETIPPFLMAGARFVIAGVILYAFATWRGAPKPTRRQWRSAAIVGAALLLLGNGAVVWAELTVPTGVVSLIVALVPIWMVLFEWVRTRGVRPTNVVFVGLGLGLAGIALLIGPGAITGDGPFPVAGALVVMLGSLGWAAGSIYARGADLPKHALLTTAMQMLAGGGMLVLLGVLLGEPARLDVSAVSVRSLGGLIYLITFGSLIGYTAYIWLLGVSTPARVSTYAYVNPVVAVLLGWGFAGEAVTSRMIVAAAIIVASVALIVSGQPRQVGPQASDDAATSRERNGRGRHRRAA